MYTLTVIDCLEWAMFMNLISGQVSKMIKAAPNTIRENSQLINYNNSLIFYAGGKLSNGSTSATVEKYDIQHDTWDLAPALNQERIIHSGCSLGENMYIYGGCTIVKKKPNFHSSVEILNVPSLLNN